MNTVLPPEVEAQLRNIAMASLNDFYAYMPMHNYIYVPTRELWPASSVNSRIEPLALLDAKSQPVLDEKGNPKKMTARAWLDRNRAVEQMTWVPGKPMLIRDRLLVDGGWIERSNVTCFNLYRPPTIEHGDASKAGPWLEHAHKVFGEETTHIVHYLAHRVQRPQEKINHALVLGGQQGIGKDTLLEPVKYAVGPWNFHEVSPQHMLGNFNSFVKSVVLRINEARDLGDVDRFQFYDHMKAYTAAPPDVLRVNEKHLREYSILNCCGVIITTNHKADGIYLPTDDRRHYVAWSNRTKEDFALDYWPELWGWYHNGGFAHVAAYLAAGETLDWLQDRKNRRIIPHRMESCGYTPVRNDAAKDGLWKINNARQAVYAKRELPFQDQLKAANRLVGGQSSQ